MEYGSVILVLAQISDVAGLSSLRRPNSRSYLNVVSGDNSFVFVCWELLVQLSVPRAEGVEPWGVAQWRESGGQVSRSVL